MKQGNRLGGAVSPYLRQHATNPVAWQPWDEIALSHSRDEDLPIILSIGYSTCHWCHAMARECFEDPEIATYMNDHFVSIKVDREERPDIDESYSRALRLLTGRNGWPATLFLTPSLVPFFGGTYFPRTGTPGFLELIKAVNTAWNTRRGEIEQTGIRVVSGMASEFSDRSPAPEGRRSAPAARREAVAQLQELYDPEFGGFGKGSKFPSSPVLSYLLLCAARGDNVANEMLEGTLIKMAHGAIRDQIDGGFHRYTTDRQWMEPHFEKTLYDNAQLGRIYVLAADVCKSREAFRAIGMETLDFLVQFMRAPCGGFVAGLDSENEEGEGRYYRWDLKELQDLAGAQAAGRVRSRYGRDTALVWLPRDGADTECLQALRDTRRRREAPPADDKILAGWNGLAIAALADVGRMLDEPRYVDAASDAAAAVLQTLWDGDALCGRAFIGANISGPAFLDDYALLGLGCLSLHEATLRTYWLRAARELAQRMQRSFIDIERGVAALGDRRSASGPLGTVTSNDDVALPSATSAAAEFLWRIGRITGDDPLVGFTNRLIDRSLQGYERSIELRAGALAVLDMQLSPTTEATLVGDRMDAKTVNLARVLSRRYRPGMVFVAACDDRADQETGIALFEGRTPHSTDSTVYLCQGTTCLSPVSDPAELVAELEMLTG